MKTLIKILRKFKEVKVISITKEGDLYVVEFSGKYFSLAREWEVFNQFEEDERAKQSMVSSRARVGLKVKSDFETFKMAVNELVERAV